MIQLLAGLIVCIVSSFVGVKYIRKKAAAFDTNLKDLLNSVKLCDATDRLKYETIKKQVQEGYEKEKEKRKGAVEKWFICNSHYLT